MSAALRMLGQREHSQREITAKLQRKFPAMSSGQMDSVIQELIENNWLSDARFAESLIRSRANRGYGPQYIERELSMKGISGDIVDAQFDEQAPDWLGIAVDLVARRHPQAQASLPHWQRAARFLQRRGFPSDIIARAVGDRPYTEAAS